MRLLLSLLLALGLLHQSLAAQCPDGSPPPCGQGTAVNPPPNSIAVLTFDNITRDTAAQYLAEGLADQIFTRLGTVARLTLVSRTAVRRLRNVDQLSVQQIGQSLNSAYLVSGSIRSVGGHVRVNVEALRATTGQAIWSDAHDRAGDDLIGLEEAIAVEVAAGVAGRLTPEERHVLQSRLTANGLAYEQFLRGNVLLARRSGSALRGAIAAYRAAAAADPVFADAYGRLSYAYALCSAWRCNTDADSLLELSREAARHGLRLNPRSSDAWMGRALLLTLWPHGTATIPDDSLLAALAAFRRAVELNPRNDEAWHQYGSTLAFLSDSAGLNAMRRALTLDPFRAITYQDISITYYAMGRIDRALQTIDSAIALAPDGPFRSRRALFRLTTGDTAGALADAQVTPDVIGSQAILAAFGHDSAAIRAMEASMASRGCVFDCAMYLLWAGRGEQAVQRILAVGPSILTRWNLRDQVFRPVAGDPRIQALRAESERLFAKARWR
jgi:TolB-like protein